MRTKFEEQLNYLNNILIDMGTTVERAIAAANKALIGQDVELAKVIIAGDDEIDGKEKEIESLCLKIIIQQQPVARDLRLISAVLKIITDLERIGDHATDISELTLLMAGREYIKKLEHIPMMAELTMKMVTDSIKAFVDKDIDLARDVIARDDEVDELFVTVKGDLIKMIREDAANGDQAIDLTMVAKYFERIGDHATNIAEWVIFSLTGVHKDIQVL